jgi:hypothetical protein
VAASRRPDPLPDLDFEPLPTRTPILYEIEPGEYQRLVVNPFLGVFGLILLAWCIRRLLESSFPPIAVFLLLGLLLLPSLIQFHCLDCGQTGLYLRRKRHTCPSVVTRWTEDRSSRFFTAHLQLVIWVWVLGSIGILLLVMRLD